MDLISNRRYERGLQHNYMILEVEQKDNNYLEFVKKMMLENKIHGLLPISVRLQDGNEAYYYEINSKQPFSVIFERRNISSKDLILLLKSYFEITKRLEDYLLEIRHLILHPEYIYLHATKMEIEFTFCPEYEKEEREALRELAEYILTKTDHTEDKAVKIAYQFYKYTREDNYTLQDIIELVDEESEDEKNERDIGISQQLTGEIIENKENIFRDELSNNVVEFEKTEFENQFTDEENSKEFEDNTRNKSNKVIATLCSIFSFVGLGILICEKILGLLSLEPQLEMFVLGITIMSAVGGIIFSLIANKYKSQKKECVEIQTIQKDMIHDEFTVSEKKDKIEKYQVYHTENNNWGYGYEIEQESFAPGETTVIGQNMVQQNILQRSDGMQYRMDHFPFVIGRMQQCVDLALTDESVSKMHAKVEKQGDEIYLQDLNSTNGTKINDTLLGINERIKIKSGDRLTFGRITFIYQ